MCALLGNLSYITWFLFLGTKNPKPKDAPFENPIKSREATRRNVSEAETVNDLYSLIVARCFSNAVSLSLRWEVSESSFLFPGSLLRSLKEPTRAASLLLQVFQSQDQQAWGDVETQRRERELLPDLSCWAPLAVASNSAAYFPFQRTSAMRETRLRNLSNSSTYFPAVFCFIADCVLMTARLVRVVFVSLCGMSAHYLLVE